MKRVDPVFFPYIERALGIELYEDTKNFLKSGLPRMEIDKFFPNDRQVGKTTAYCISLALSEGRVLNFRLYKYSDEIHDTNYDRWFRNYFRDIHCKLRSAGFKVRDCIF